MSEPRHIIGDHFRAIVGTGLCGSVLSSSGWSFRIGVGNRGEVVVVIRV